MSEPSEKRAALVAALREIADLLEADTSLPLPYATEIMAGLPGCVLDENDRLRTTTEAERFAAVRRGASALGVEVIEESDRSRRAVRYFGPVAFRVYAAPDAQPASKPQRRVVSADEDAALIGGGA